MGVTSPLICYYSHLLLRLPNDMHIVILPMGGGRLVLGHKHPSRESPWSKLAWPPVRTRLSHAHTRNWCIHWDSAYCPHSCPPPPWRQSPRRMLDPVPSAFGAVQGPRNDLGSQSDSYWNFGNRWGEHYTSTTPKRSFVQLHVGAPSISFRWG